MSLGEIIAEEHKSNSNGNSHHSTQHSSHTNGNSDRERSSYNKQPSARGNRRKQPYAQYTAASQSPLQQQSPHRLRTLGPITTVPNTVTTLNTLPMLSFQLPTHNMNTLPYAANTVTTVSTSSQPLYGIKELSGVVLNSALLNAAGAPMSSVTTLTDPTPVSGRVLKVSAKSNPKHVAGSISHTSRSGDSPALIATGAISVNQAIKAIAIARGYLEDNKIGTCRHMSVAQVCRACGLLRVHVCAVADDSECVLLS